MRNLALAFLAVAATSSFAAVISTFDTDTDGWTMINLPDGGPYTGAGTPVAGLTWIATGGSPDGHISRTDGEGGGMFFRAPAKFHGDQSVMLGGTVSFDIKSTHDGRTVDSNVVLKGAGLTLVGKFDNPVANAGWFSRSVVLDAANFRHNTQSGAVVSEAQLTSVLANVTDLLIGGETHTGVGVETTALDNVQLEAVPEPATMLLLGSGVAAFMARRRKKTA